MFIDTHCHLEDENFSDDREKVLERAKAAGVERIINFGSTLKSSAVVVELAKNFLSDKGVIFISIDDNEQANLKLLCDKIFGEENFVANLIWQKKLIILFVTPYSAFDCIVSVNLSFTSG